MAGTLETPRLVLRPVAREDQAELLALLRDGQVRRYLADGELVGHTSVSALLSASEATFREDGVGMYLALPREGTGVVGLVGLRRAEIGGFELVVAFWPRHWGKGLAEEAARTLLRHAFQEAKLPRVVAGVDAPNAASIRLFARLGFHDVRQTKGAFGAIRWLALDRPPALTAPRRRA